MISDFDNTLYDWFHMWDRSFTAMLSEIERISGVSKDDLIPQIRQIHQRHGTSEYSHLIEDLPCLRAAFPNQDLLRIFDDAIHAYRSAAARAEKAVKGVAGKRLMYHQPDRAANA